jgi:hypothetical protein
VAIRVGGETHSLQEGSALEVRCDSRARVQG